jgi:predicted nucleic-acid-binding protein
VKGIDTNVLVRYLVQDEPLQGRKAAAFITKECSADSPGLINRVVLCELVWVLETAYRYPRSQVAQALDRILRTSQFEIEDHQEAWSGFARVSSRRRFCGCADCRGEPAPGLRIQGNL